MNHGGQREAMRRNESRFSASGKQMPVRKKQYIGPLQTSCLGN